MIKTLAIIGLGLVALFFWIKSKAPAGTGYPPGYQPPTPGKSLGEQVGAATSGLATLYATIFGPSGPNAPGGPGEGPGYGATPPGGQLGADDIMTPTWQ